MANGWTKKTNTTYADLLNHSGEFTYSGRICGPTLSGCQPVVSFGYEIGLENWEGNAEVTKSGSKKTCNEEMLVTWFNSAPGTPNRNKTYATVLNDASIFEMKNIDECKHILQTKNTTDYPFITSAISIFDTEEYVDSGYPDIAIDPCGENDNNCQKYKATHPYDGHKIKYLPNSNTIPSNCITNNNNLVEIYFPHLFDSDNLFRATKTISASAFTNNYRLSAVTFSAVEDIGDFAFLSCSGLTNIDWGHLCCGQESQIITIGKSAFRNLKSIETLCLDKLGKVESIDSLAFYNCTNVKLLKLPTSSAYTTVTDRCFDRLGNDLQPTDTLKIYIPNNITNIADGSLYFGRNPKVEIYMYWDNPNDVILGSQAFNSNNSNVDVIVPSGKKGVYETWLNNKGYSNFNVL